MTSHVHYLFLHKNMLQKRTCFFPILSLQIKENMPQQNVSIITSLCLSKTKYHLSNFLWYRKWHSWLNLLVSKINFHLNIFYVFPVSQSIPLRENHLKNLLLAVLFFWSTLHYACRTYLTVIFWINFLAYILSFIFSMEKLHIERRMTAVEKK